GIFDDWNIMPGCTERYRRVLLAPSGQGKGAFAGLMGKNTIELVQALDHTPRKIFEGRQWGDPGFIQICFDVCGTDALGAHCAALGHPFTVDSCPDGQKFNMGDAAGRFTYIEDPDGTLIEFVETEKVPVVKKLGWFIDLKKRDPQKELPKFLFRLMGLVSREKIK
ncbi:MAG: VOC family protein, partial [Bacteroidales bacterium]|nr:VOC family protein [Bacteroidales bacterium]